MAVLARVEEVGYLGDRVLRVVFSDGMVRELDFASALPGILASIDDDTVFATVDVDQLAGTVCWPNGIDLDPNVLHGDQTPASDQGIRVVREYRLQETV